jgi:hypothetical protein
MMGKMLMLRVNGKHLKSFFAWESLFSLYINFSFYFINSHCSNSISQRIKHMFMRFWILDNLQGVIIPQLEPIVEPILCFPLFLFFPFIFLPLIFPFYIFHFPISFSPSFSLSLLWQDYHIELFSLCLQTFRLADLRTCIMFPLPTYQSAQNLVYFCIVDFQTCGLADIRGIPPLPLCLPNIFQHLSISSI